MTKASSQLSDDLETSIGGIESEYLLVEKDTFNWLAYRTAIKNNLKIFQAANIDGKNLGKSLIKAWKNALIGEEKSKTLFDDSTDAFIAKIDTNQPGNNAKSDIVMKDIENDDLVYCV